MVSTYTELGNLARETALQQSMEAMYRAPQYLFQAVLRPENLLGSGSRTSVYRIPQVSDYVLQVVHGLTAEAMSEVPLMARVPERLPGLNIGQPIYSTQGGLVQVLRYQAGRNSAIPFNDFFQKYGIDELLGEGISMKAADVLPYRSVYINHLRTISEMPQSAYDQLAGRIIIIQKAGLFLDPCSLNLLVDPSGERFNTIDHQECIGPYENVLGMLCLLMDTMFVDLDDYAVHGADIRFQTSLARHPGCVALRRRILRKSLRAALKVGLDWPEVSCPKNSFGYYQRSFDVEYAFSIAGITSKQCGQVASLFQKKEIIEHQLLDEILAA